MRTEVNGLEDQGLDFFLELKRIEYGAPKVNRGVQIVFVINGVLTVETNSRFYSLAENDLLLLNRNQLYQVHGTNDNCVLLLTITDAFIDRYYPDYHRRRFQCFSREVEMGRELKIDKIRRLLAEMMITYLRRDESYKLEIQGTICQILLILIRNFSGEGTAFEKIDADDQRLTQIIDYMERNYEQQITLEEMAQKAFLSTGYLSRYFKQKMGMGFSRFLMNIRLKHGVKDLLYTTDSISQIAMKNGFPNTKSFSNLFKESYGVTPHEYRETHSPEQQVDSIHSYHLHDSETLMKSPEVLTKLGMILTASDKMYVNTETRYEELAIELLHEKRGAVNLPENILIIGELKELLKEDVRSQVLMVKEELGLRFIGIRHLVSGATILPTVETDERFATTSPYFNTDGALNFMKKNDLSLFVRVDYKEISIDEEQYFSKLTKFLKHCLQVYGENYLNTWHFMFNEPYYTAVKATDLHRVYLKLYRLLKQHVPGIQVGVFLPFSFHDEKIPKEHEWQLEEKGRIDFIGYHANQNEVIDFNEMGDYRFSLAKDYIMEKTNKIKGFLKQHQINKPFFLVSWNTLSGNTRYTNGTFFRGALVLKNALDLTNEIDSLAFWINTELHEEDKMNLRIRLEGLELFHYFNGKRPAFYSMLFANKLQGEVVAKGQDYFMTQTELGYQLVLMNCNYVNPYFSIEEAFLQKLNKDIRVKISGMQQGEYQIRKYIFDKDNGALYTNWWKLGSKHGMDAEIIDYITRSSQPSLEIFDESIEENWVFYSYMTTNAIHFFDIRKVIE
ncbi:helix-turn-helix domain-containing protein [Neobacillus vireti]|uniref:AraC family transcriptional regulator n=1 Tax=Neobacillus vireti LMG 21834 TaxID=1131730 RepID=A0AB94IRB4_9BACI|nr:helix-turn-helix domain-containing protein [Neobacillus vireti]ETI69621.1 AraC family transcriptional regulator [Neobacillus vireti LMG 21834]